MATSGVVARGGEKKGGREAVIEQAVRREVARELHDRVAQTLTGMIVEVENFKSQQVGWDDVLKQMETVQSSTRQVLSSLRQMLHDLRGDENVGETFVNDLGTLIAGFEEKTRIRAVLEVRPGWPVRLAGPASLHLYRIVEEALANVRMHSGAGSVHIVLDSSEDGQLRLVVDDNGRGTDTHPSRRPGLGTVGMKERAVLLGGSLRIDSEAGSGTTIHALFPRAHLIPLDDPTRPSELIKQGA